MLITPIRLHNQLSFSSRKTPKNKNAIGVFQQVMLKKEDRKEVREQLQLLKRNFNQTVKNEIKVNPKLISMAKKPPQIIVYETIDEANSKAQIGEVFEFEGKLFCKNKNDITPIKLSKETFLKLFPPLETLALSQAEIGNCYFISAVFDFLKNENARNVIFSMFEETENEIIVTIPDCKNHPVKFPQKTIKSKPFKHIYGAVGIQMLEKAYCKTRSKMYDIDDSTEILNYGNQRQIYNSFLNSQNAISFQDETVEYEFTCEENILEELEEIEEDIKLLKSALKDKKVFDAYYFSSRTQILEQLKEHYSMIRSLNADFGNMDKIFQTSIDELLDIVINHANNPDFLISISSRPEIKPENKKGIISAHAYSILKVDNENETIDIVNPHNCSAYTTISFEEFKKYFSSVDMIRIQ